ncbi:MAG TPA: SDR family oxidoreductase [Rudaea sp.]|jgi:short-subunit dehydrogenase|nr:SDR family oxidoreductase [Rudaea sp.]
MARKHKAIKEQVVVITGASSGIGRATAEAMAQKGATLVLAARSVDALERDVNACKAAGVRAIAVEADVSKRDDMQKIAAAAIAEFGRIDTWVNNAGVSIYGRLDEVSEKDSRRLFDVNFWGVVNGSLTALPYLQENAGALINVGSEVSDAVAPLQGMYSASKHAVKGFTDALRVEIEEVDKSPISITLIQPTAVNTPYPQHARNYMDDEPALPTPQIDPTQVAQAIIDAAESPTRDVKVGAMSKMNTLMFKILPSLADKMSAKQVDRQHYEEEPRNPEGALYRPSGGGGIHGVPGPRPQ